VAHDRQGSEFWKDSAGKFIVSGAQTGGISSNKKKKASSLQLTLHAQLDLYGSQPPQKFRRTDDFNSKRLA
jgi:hypothetical protein